MIEPTTEQEEKFAEELVMTLPSVIRVGLFDFRIEKLSGNQCTNKFGECSTVEQAIRIQRTMPTRYKAVDTFIHEVIHAIYWSYGAQDTDGEERMVELMATGMSIVHRDNPWLVDWIKSAKL